MHVINLTLKKHKANTQTLASNHNQVLFTHVKPLQNHCIIRLIYFVCSYLLKGYESKSPVVGDSSPARSDSKFVLVIIEVLQHTPTF